MNIAKHITLASMALLVVGGWMGCKPELQGELGEPFNKLEGMIGVWEMGSFSQTDLQSPLTEVRDLSELYIDGIVTPLQITLNEDFTYSVSIEKGRNYFGDGGQWSLDDEEHPTFLILATEDADGNPLDTVAIQPRCRGSPSRQPPRHCVRPALRRKPRLGLHLQLQPTVMMTASLQHTLRAAGMAWWHAPL